LPVAFGLIAEDVADVAPDLVGRNKKGQPESVRYEQINAMLLNEFLKEHKKVHELEIAVAEQRNHFDATIADLEKQIERVVARSKNQGEEVQKFIVQIEPNKAAPQVVSRR
jgi:arylsulfatase A-like enzyme